MSFNLAVSTCCADSKVSVKRISKEKNDILF